MSQSEEPLTDRIFFRWPELANLERAKKSVWSSLPITPRNLERIKVHQWSSAIGLRMPPADELKKREENEQE